MVPLHKTSFLFDISFIRLIKFKYNILAWKVNVVQENPISLQAKQLKFCDASRWHMVLGKVIEESGAMSWGNIFFKTQVFELRITTLLGIYNTLKSGAEGKLLPVAMSLKFHQNMAFTILMLMQRKTISYAMFMADNSFLFAIVLYNNDLDEEV